MSAAHKAKDFDPLVLAGRWVTGAQFLAHAGEVIELAFLDGLLDPPVGDLPDGDAEIGGVEKHAQIVAATRGLRRIAWSWPMTLLGRTPSACRNPWYPTAHR